MDNKEDAQEEWKRMLGLTPEEIEELERNRKYIVLGHPEDDTINSVVEENTIDSVVEEQLPSEKGDVRDLKLFLSANGIASFITSLGTAIYTLCALNEYGFDRPLQIWPTFLITFALTFWSYTSFQKANTSYWV